MERTGTKSDKNRLGWEKEKKRNDLWGRKYFKANLKIILVLLDTPTMILPDVLDKKGRRGHEVQHELHVHIARV